jgi:hypothetical protein
LRRKIAFQGNSHVTDRIASISTCVLVAASIFLAPSLRAQQTTGAILGSVQDSQGGFVVNAQVTAQNQETGFTRTIPTNSQGEYRIDFLPPGNSAKQQAPSPSRAACRQ